jgi:hypothetical protein
VPTGGLEPTAWHLAHEKQTIHIGFELVSQMRRKAHHQKHISSCVL